MPRDGATMTCNRTLQLSLFQQVNVLEPHPTSCILATSGLDHDIKVWEPLGTPFSDENEKLKQVRIPITSS